MVSVATHRLSVAQPGLMITPMPRAQETVAMKRRLLSMPSFMSTLMPDKAMEPKRNVVMPPITQVGVLAKKAPICVSSQLSK